MTRPNEDLRRQIKNAGARFGQIADRMKISEATLTRRFRREMSEAEKNEVLKAVNEIRSGR